MNDINKIFFELIRVAIGNADGLSHIPKPKEWQMLYDMAKKQSLVGICFAGLQRLGADADSGFSKLGLTEMQYLTWMGMAAKIQQRNEVVNRQCVELCSLLNKEGFRACILKGQGTGALYRVNDGDTLRYDDLSKLRQSGDIDVWVMPDDVRTIKNSRPRINEMVHRWFPDEKGAFVHIGFPVYNDTEVEVHYVPTMDGNPWVDRRFRRMFEERQDECFASTKLSTGSVNELGFAVPEPMVNVLFNLHHIKRHFITSGIGLRHVLDLYFVRQRLGVSRDARLEVRDMIKKLGMEKFFAGMMWVMQEVILNEDENCRPDGTLTPNLGISPNPKLGKFILQEIMQGGNFGHHDERLKGVNEMGFWERWKQFLSVSISRARYFPRDVFWSYVFRLKIGIWRKTGLEI